ncbi:hypothetical protein [Lentzea sp. CC55]|uniref:hypothetical protein n=1 Tax=Lentzea sp. CC55 TaxID=2884909 RepID=UPI001F3E6998|nr:hypothetical protein [Lentzea sp. CC55]MCG8925047.1 hypothetical protein [Lentzea sp. CC55]
MRAESHVSITEPGDAARELRELRRIERRLTVNDPEPTAMSMIIGMFTGLLTFAFIGLLVLMAGACLHITCRRQRRAPGRG